LESAQDLKKIGYHTKYLINVLSDVCTLLDNNKVARIIFDLNLGLELRIYTCGLLPLNNHGNDYNESLIERGQILMDIGFLKSQGIEIRKMNMELSKE
jgi:hypothetical protein